MIYRFIHLDSGAWGGDLRARVEFLMIGSCLPADFFKFESVATALELGIKIPIKQKKFFSMFGFKHLYSTYGYETYVCN